MTQEARLTTMTEYSDGAHASPLAPYFSNARADLATFLRTNGVSLAGRVLEVGCAAGAAGPHLRGLGATVLEGIEPHSGAAAVAEASGHYDAVYKCTFDQWSAPAELYDTVVFADVLEHLADPADVLRRVHGLLQPSSGQLVLSLPNVRHLSVLAGLLVAGDWRYRVAGILDETHLRFFTSKSASRLLADHGYEVVVFKRWGAMALSRYICQVWPWLGEFILSQFFVVSKCVDIT